MSAFAGIFTALLQLAYLFLAPAFGLWLCRRYPWAEKLGPIAFAYGFGLLLSQWPAQLAVVSEQVRDLAIPLAIPLLLFSLNVRAWLTSARETLLAFALCLLALLLCSTLAAFVFHSHLDQSADVAGILTGLYSGGTPNAAVVHRALEAPPLLFAQLNAIDFVSGAVYFLFLISLAGPLYGLFLPVSPVTQITQHGGDEVPRWDIRGSALAFFMALLIVGVTVAVVLSLTGRLHLSLIMLGITSLAIAASFWPRLRAVRSSYDAGYYLVSVFCCAIGSQLSLEQFDRDMLALAAMHLSVLMGTIALHLIFARMAKLDRDTTIITQTAALYGPPFVPPVAGALRNPGALLSGLTTGLVGYALGNYLGIGLALLLR